MRTFAVSRGEAVARSFRAAEFRKVSDRAVSDEHCRTTGRRLESAWNRSVRSMSGSAWWGGDPVAYIQGRALAAHDQ